MTGALALIVILRPVKDPDRDSFPSIEFVHGFEHGNDILDGSSRLYIMDGIKNEPTALRKDFASAQNLFPHFSRRSEGENSLRIDSSTPEHKLVTKIRFQLLGVHSSRGALYRIENVDSGFDEGRKKL